MNSFDICKNNWRMLLVGTPELLRNGDETVIKRIKACSDKAMDRWKEFKQAFRTESPVGFFRTQRAVQSYDMTIEYSKLCDMALGYGTFGTECYRNEELLKDILDAMEWGYHNYYGKAEMEDKGWRSIRQFNWWDWWIGTPSALMKIMVIVDESLTLEKKRDYLALFDMGVPVPRDYGSNKVNFGALIARSGILCENSERIFVGRDGIEDTYLYADGGVNDGQGFYRDGSYVFHTRHPMNFIYGLEHFSAVIDFASILNGSEFALKSEHTELLYTWLYKSYLPFCRNGEVFRSVLGRDPCITRPINGVFIRALTRLYGISDGDKETELAALLTLLTDEHPLSCNGECGEIFSALTLNDYLLFKRAYGIKSDKIHRKGMFAFNCMDRAVQQTEKYAFSLSVSSSRIYNYECINHQNMNGWYHGDGLLCLISTPFKYGKEYWQNIDPYRIPGTTVDGRKREVVSIAQANEYLSSKSFVGTLETGDTGVSVMELESYHGDGTLVSTRFYKPTGEYGSAPPARECSLTANKAYFFMNGYVVCLGSAVNAHDGADVYTVIENRHGVPVIENGTVKGFKIPEISINGSLAKLSATDTAISGVKYFNIDGDAYCILDGKDVTFKMTDSELPFVQAIIDHGVSPENESYAYAILPLASSDEVESFVSNSPIEILENSASVQAVREKKSGDRYFVFHDKAELDGVSVENPLLVSIKNGELYACDVTQMLTCTTVTVNGKKYAFDLTNAHGKRICVKL